MCVRMPVTASPPEGVRRSPPWLDEHGDLAAFELADVGTVLPPNRCAHRVLIVAQGGAVPQPTRYGDAVHKRIKASVEVDSPELSFPLTHFRYDLTVIV